MLKINEFFYRLQGKDMFVCKNHSHNEIELIYVIRGNGFVLKNDKTYELKSGYLYAIDARNTHVVYPQPENCDNYVRDKIVIDADSFVTFFSQIGLADAIERMFDSAPIFVFNASEIDGIYEEVSRLCNIKSAESLALAHSYIIRLVCWINSNKTNPIPCDEKSTLQKMLDIINERDGVTSLDEISKLIYMNKNHLCRLFKEKTGITLSDYLSNKVYEKSKKLLAGTSFSVEKIAALCGFSSAASFTRFFKSKDGIPPSEFRKKVQHGIKLHF